jgi:hypothetical protein
MGDKSDVCRRRGGMLYGWRAGLRAGSVITRLGDLSHLGHPLTGCDTGNESLESDRAYLRDTMRCDAGWCLLEQSFRALVSYAPGTRITVFGHSKAPPASPRPRAA